MYRFLTTYLPHWSRKWAVSLRTAPERAVPVTIVQVLGGKRWSLAVIRLHNEETP